MWYNQKLQDRHSNFGSRDINGVQVKNGEKLLQQKFPINKTLLSVCLLWQISSPSKGSPSLLVPGHPSCRPCVLLPACLPCSWQPWRTSRSTSCHSLSGEMGPTAERCSQKSPYLYPGQGLAHPPSALSTYWVKEKEKQNDHDQSLPINKFMIIN